MPHFLHEKKDGKYKRISGQDFNLVHAEFSWCDNLSKSQG